MVRTSRWGEISSNLFWNVITTVFPTRTALFSLLSNDIETGACARSTRFPTCVSTDNRRQWQNMVILRGRLSRSDLIAEEEANDGDPHLPGGIWIFMQIHENFAVRVVMCRGASELTDNGKTGWVLRERAASNEFSRTGNPGPVVIMFCGAVFLLRHDSRCSLASFSSSIGYTCIYSCSLFRSLFSLALTSVLGVVVTFDGRTE